MQGNPRTAITIIKQIRMKLLIFINLIIIQHNSMILIQPQGNSKGKGQVAIVTFLKYKIVKEILVTLKYVVLKALNLTKSLLSLGRLNKVVKHR